MVGKPYLGITSRLLVIRTASAATNNGATSLNRNMPEPRRSIDLAGQHRSPKWKSIES
jgi:hypothetical protein